MSDTEFSIDDITAEFGEVYLTVKGTKETDGWEKILKDAQVEFFAAATRELEQGTLARKTVKMPEGTVSQKGDWLIWVKTYHPGWRFVSFKKDSAHDMIIEEDPSVKTFAYLNMQDNMVYRRSQTQTGPSLDIERLREDDPDLYHRVTVWLPSVYDLVRDALVWAYDSVHNPEPETVATEETEKFMEDQAQRNSSVRIVLDPGVWTPEQATQLKPYIIPGKVSVRLTPPRKAKVSELETGEVEE